MTKRVKIGGVTIGGGAEIAVQTMTDTRTCDVEATVNQINQACQAGAKIVRVAVRDEVDAQSIKAIKARISCPIVADIHFDYRLALASIDGGADKIRINPGNIGSENNVREVAVALRQNGIPVRVGTNSGSLESSFERKYGGVTAAALAESALAKAAMLEKYGVSEIVLAAKSSNVKMMYDAYTYISTRCDYPLHIGVTEAGTAESGLIKGAIGIGALLLNGIGDTLRVSLSAPPVDEVKAGYAILRAVGLNKDFVEVVACPTCGRCDYDCKALAARITEVTRNVHKQLKVSVMGCVVNGVGEAKESDLGIAGSKECCVIFKKGKTLRKVAPCDAEREFIKELENCLKQKLI